MQRLQNDMQRTHLMVWLMEIAVLLHSCRIWWFYARAVVE